MVYILILTILYHTLYNTYQGSDFMNEIKLTDHIRNSLRTARKNNKIKGIDICKALGKHPSFISHIENDVVKTVELDDLKNILNYIFQIDGDKLDDYIDKLINTSSDKTTPDSSYDRRNSSLGRTTDFQQMFEDSKNRRLEELEGIIDLFREDIANYPSYDQCEKNDDFETADKFLTTFTNLMLKSERETSDKFYDLMKLPLFKLNPVQFQELIDCAKGLLEYEYVFDSGKSKTIKYPHFEVKYRLESQK